MNKRERLGRIVRDAYVRWALLQPHPRPSLSLSWEEVDESDREGYQQIGEAVADDVVQVLRDMYEILHLDDLVYNVRDSEGLGWDGPKVKAWADACERARKLLGDTEC